MARYFVHKVFCEKPYGNPKLIELDNIVRQYAKALIECPIYRIVSDIENQLNELNEKYPKRRNMVVSFNDDTMILYIKGELCSPFASIHFCRVNMVIRDKRTEE